MVKYEISEENLNKIVGYIETSLNCKQGNPLLNALTTMMVKVEEVEEQKDKKNKQK